MKLIRWVVLNSIVFLSACGSGGNSQSPNLFSSNAIFSSSVSAIAIDQNSGDIYVVGNFTTYNGTASDSLVRLNSDGSIDTSFNVGTGFNTAVRAVTIAADGSGDIYVGGDFSLYNGITVLDLIRLNSDGSIDTNFNTGSGFGGGSGVVAITVATDGSGDVYIGGQFSSYKGITSPSIVRLNTDGSYDTGFDTGTGFDSTVFDIAIATDGSDDVYAAGAFSSYDGNTSENIVRINSDGSYDAGFDTGSGFNSHVLSIAVAADGSGDIYAGGNFSIYRGNSRDSIARINSDGSNDAGFNPGLGANGTIRAVATAPDGSGNIYIGGQSFTSFNGTAVGQVACLEPTGVQCVSFDSGSGFDSDSLNSKAFVNTIVSANDGRGGIYIGGFFNFYDNTVLGNLALLDSSGQLQ